MFYNLAWERFASKSGDIRPDENCYIKKCDSRMYVDIGLGHVKIHNMDTFSESIIEAIVSCEVISTSPWLQ